MIVLGTISISSVQDCGDSIWKPIIRLASGNPQLLGYQIDRKYYKPKYVNIGTKMFEFKIQSKYGYDEVNCSKIINRNCAVTV